MTMQPSQTALPRTAPKAAAGTGAAKAPARRPAAKPKRALRPRILPATIFAAVLLLGARVGDVWTTVTTGAPLTLDVAASVAEQAVTDGLPPANLPAAATVKPVQVAAAETKPAEAPPSAAPAAAAPAAEPATQPAPASPAGSDGFTPSEVELLQRLQERREQLDDRARQLDQREALLQVAEQRLEQKVGELEGLRNEIRGLLNQVNEEQKAQLDSLVKIYETMKPKEAAAVFEGLDNAVLLNVIGQMRESKLAPIFGAMDPKRVAEITILRADQKNLPTLPE